MSGTHGRARWLVALTTLVVVGAGVAVPASAVVETPGDAGVIVAGSRTAGGIPVVRTFADRDGNGTYETLVDELVPYRNTISDGVRVAMGDFDGDTNDELVVASDKSSSVKIYEMGTDGSPGARIDSEPGFAHGTYVATGDVNGDGRDELITGSGPGDGEVVKIRADLDLDGKPDDETDSFAAYPASNDGGVRVAAGNINNSGGDEVITAPGPDPLVVKVWTDADADRAVSDGPMLDVIRPFGATFAAGMYVAAGAFQNAGGNGAELVISRGDGVGKTVIRTDTDNDGVVSDNPPFDHIDVPYPGATKGARVAAGDTDNSGSLTELITAPGGGPPASSPLTIFDDDGDAGSLISDNPPTQSSAAFTGNPGVYVAFGKVQTAVYTNNGFPQTIPDVSTITSTIHVPASAGIVKDVDVSLNISHSFDGDLDVSLNHAPSGDSLVLFNDVGGTNEGFQIRLNDEAGTDIGTASNPKLDGSISGTFNPQGAGLLSTFDGDDASGDWILTITDDSGGDTGTLNSWSLTVTY